MLKVQMNVRSTGLKVLFPEFLFNYTQICLFLKNHHFGKCSHLIFLYIIGYNDISWRINDPHDLHPEIWGCDHNPSGFTAMNLATVIVIAKFYSATHRQTPQMHIS